MIAAIVAAACALAAVGAVLWIPVRLDVQYRKNALQSGASVYLRVGFIKIRLTGKPHKKKTGKEGSEPSFKRLSFSEFKKQYRAWSGFFSENKEEIAGILRYARDHALVVEKIDFRLEYGFEDPMYTGLAMGAISGGAYNLLAVLTRWLEVDGHSIDIRPDFENRRFAVNFWCILRVKTVHIMVVTVKILRLVRRLEKNKGNSK